MFDLDTQRVQIVNPFRDGVVHAYGGGEAEDDAPLPSWPRWTRVQADQQHQAELQKTFLNVLAARTEADVAVRAAGTEARLVPLIGMMQN